MCLSRKRLLMPSASTIRSLGKSRFVVDVGFEQQRHAEFAGALLQESAPAASAEQPQKTVAADAVDGAAEVHACSSQ